MDDRDPLERLEQQRRQQPRTRSEFTQELRNCDQALVRVGTVVADIIRPMTTAFLEGDEVTAQRLITKDDEVDRECRDLEERCYELIARQSPVAKDLRRIVGLLRSSQDVERSGDLIRHVGEALAWVHPPSFSPEVREHVQQLGTLTADLFRRALDAWKVHDGLAANELDKADDQVDLVQKHLLTDLYTQGTAASEAVSLALLARYYERIADHGVQIAREVAYYLTGERVVGLGQSG